MFRKIIRQFVILLFLSCCVMSTAQPSADELSAMMAEDVRIAQELSNEMPANERLAMVEKLSANYSRLCGLVAEDLEKAYQEDGTGKTYVPAIPMVLEAASRSATAWCRRKKSWTPSPRFRRTTPGATTSCAV